MGPIFEIYISQAQMFVIWYVYTHTLTLIVSLVARQFLHLRSANPTSTLKPPIEWAA